MRILSLLCIFLLAGVACSTMHTNDSPPETVAHVDIDKYTGLWYEIARYPNEFQEGCQGVTAEYEVIKENTLRVVNSCYEDSLGGELKMVTGKAFVQDNSGNAKLKVQFQWPFKGDYWILDLGLASPQSEKYYYAIVGDPDREYLWILSRSRYLEEEQLQKIRRVIIDKGYAPEKLVYTRHLGVGKKKKAK